MIDFLNMLFVGDDLLDYTTAYSALIGAFSALIIVYGVEFIIRLIDFICKKVKKNG